MGEGGEGGAPGSGRVRETASGDYTPVDPVETGPVLKRRQAHVRCGHTTHATNDEFLGVNSDKLGVGDRGMRGAMHGGFRSRRPGQVVPRRSKALSTASRKPR
jgi:hypothetical protein